MLSGIAAWIDILSVFAKEQKAQAVKANRVFIFKSFGRHATQAAVEHFRLLADAREQHQQFHVINLQRSGFTLHRTDVKRSALQTLVPYRKYVTIPSENFDAVMTPIE